MTLAGIFGSLAGWNCPIQYHLLCWVTWPFSYRTTHLLTDLCSSVHERHGPSAMTPLDVSLDNPVCLLPTVAPALLLTPVLLLAPALLLAHAAIVLAFHVFFYLEDSKVTDCLVMFVVSFLSECPNTTLFLLRICLATGFWLPSFSQFLSSDYIWYSGNIKTAQLPGTIIAEKCKSNVSVILSVKIANQYQC